MAHSDASTKWQRIEGALHVLIGLPLLFLLGTLLANSVRNKISLMDVLTVLFFFGIGAALLWIGIAQLRDRRRPSWIVRLALYLPILTCLPMTIQVMREAVAKRRAINNLRQLGEALRQYEADFKIAPNRSIESETESPEDDLPLQ